MGSHARTAFGTTKATKGRLRWKELRCVRCRRLLLKVEDNALRPGKRLEIKCGHCKVLNYLVGVETDSAVPIRQEP